MPLFSTLNPVPGFPAYSGPYKVGSFDVEIPASELNAPSPAPDSTISTVAYRVFYPCEPGSHEKPVRWIPNPQRGYMSAYARFLGANSAFSQLFAYFPQLLYYISLPVHRNARLLAPPTKSARWPVMFFSHGLGGSRNAYSHIVGSLSSHGIVVIAPDHRDGSAPISYIRATESSQARAVEYKSLPHQPSTETFEGRDEQLKIRMWELGLIHDAVLRMDAGGDNIRNLDPNKSHHHKGDFDNLLSMFKDKLDVHRPGGISWAGHSFGAATTLQFVKSVYYRPSSEEQQKENYFPLFTPSSDSVIVKQITNSSPVALLDLWCLPAQNPKTRWLHDKPMPCYTDGGPGGSALVAVLSEAFFKWTTHLAETKRLLSEDPSTDSPPHTQSSPRFFYPLHSAHLSQSDFGILFPWATKKIFKAEEPERTLKLNVRAILQVLREQSIEVAETSRIDREEEVEAAEGKKLDVATEADGRIGDWKILDTSGSVRGWIALMTDQDVAGSSEAAADKGPADAVVEGEVLGEVISREDQKM